MFRMEEHAFKKKLCSLVCGQIGEDIFKPEAYIVEKKGGSVADSKFITGEAKMTVSIRMLAGGSYLDLVPLSAVCSSHL